MNEPDNQPSETDVPQDAAPVEANEPNVDDALPVDAGDNPDANTPVEENSENVPDEVADTPDE